MYFIPYTDSGLTGRKEVHHLCEWNHLLDAKRPFFWEVGIGFFANNIIKGIRWLKIYFYVQFPNIILGIVVFVKIFFG